MSNIIINLFKEKESYSNEISNLGDLFKEIRLSPKDLNHLYVALANKESDPIEALLIKKTENIVRSYFKRVNEADISLEKKNEHLDKFYDMIYSKNDSLSVETARLEEEISLAKSLTSEAFGKESGYSRFDSSAIDSYRKVLFNLDFAKDRILSKGSKNSQTNPSESPFFVVKDMNFSSTYREIELIHASNIDDSMAGKDGTAILLINNPIYDPTKTVNSTYKNSLRFYRNHNGINFTFQNFYHMFATVWFYNELEHYKVHEALWKDTPLANILFNLLMDVFNYKTLVENMKEGKAVATAYMTKKGIPLAHKKAMEKNIFLNKFDYVEIDQAVDLELFNDIQEDFQTYTSMFNFPVLNAPSFRIRKLGKHKASGLYYPAYNTIVVDGRDVGGHSCSAFTHELGHYLDYNLIENSESNKHMLSMTEDFAPVREYFSQLMNESPKETVKPYLTKWYYYLSPVELFARSFELYINERLKEKDYNSNFLKDESEYNNSVIYKHDSHLMTLIRDYFDNLLSPYFENDEPKVKKEEKEVVVLKSSASKITPTTKLGSESDQMDLFDFL